MNDQSIFKRSYFTEIFFEYSRNCKKCRFKSYLIKNCNGKSKGISGSNLVTWFVLIEL